ncbi:hypothetical protein [Arcobacter sp. FWKO B]|uniref:hypothetical protein n=1 Tax=Arcobacter sp. FWKO B TaxID=2593672 RepID=UPI0018A5758F|nr:hypothetical protein [Arcobacter sp. FWKO B]QOG12439.1 hypothetical protein FWKOB_06875 [Arcobacter sp. FWKO B]
MSINIDAQTLSIQGSTLTAEQAVIISEIMELVSLKNSEYENHFRDKSGVITRTIASKGSVSEEIVPALIQVQEQLIVNNQDITDQLTTDNIIKTLSSQSDLSIEQINLIKATLNNQQWDDKTTSLSGLGAIIVAIVVTVITAGAGAAVVGAAGGAAAGTATAAATTATLTTTIQTAVAQSLVTGVTTQLATSAITGNSFKLDTDSLIKGAVSAGVMSYASSFTTNTLVADSSVYDYAKNAVVRGTAQGISSELMGGEFKDGFATGATLSVVNDGALQMRKYVKDNFDYAGKNGEPIPDNVRSIGVNGDGVKLEGSHPEKVIENGVIIGKNEIKAPFGGEQMGERLIFGIPYSENGIIAHTLSAFAGPHDYLSSWNYENIDINGQTNTVLKDNGTLVNVASGLLLMPSVPFATAPFIQNNINELNTINYIRKQEEKKSQDFIKQQTQGGLYENN